MSQKSTNIRRSNSLRGECEHRNRPIFSDLARSRSNVALIDIFIATVLSVGERINVVSGISSVDCVAG